MDFVKNLLKNVGMFVTRPARDLAEYASLINAARKVKRVESPTFTNEQLRQLGGSEALRALPEMQRYRQNLIGSDLAYKNLMDYKPTFLAEQEMEGLLDYSRALKDAAITGSVMMPTFGKGLAGAIGTGAAGGALGGYGGSRRGEELQDIVTGGLTGGALGGAGYGAGQLLSRMFPGRGQLSTKELLGQEPGTISKVGGMQQAEQYTSMIDDLLRKNKLPMATRTQRARSIEQLLNITGKNIDELLRESTQGISTDIIENIAKESVGTLSEESSKEPLRRVVAELGKKADDAGIVSAKDVNDIMATIKKTGTEFGKSQKGGQKEAADAIWEAIRTFLVGSTQETGEQVTGLLPELAKPKAQYSALKTVAGPVQRWASGAKRGARAVGLEVPLSGEVIQPFFDVLTRGIKGTGRPLGALTSLPSKVSQFIGPGKIGGVTGAAQTADLSGSKVQQLLESVSRPGEEFLPTGVQQGIQEFGTQPTGMQPTGDGVIPEEQGVGLGLPEGFYLDPVTGFIQMSPTGGMGGYGVQSALSEAQQMFPNASESELLSLANMLMEERAPTELSKEEIQLQSAENIIDEIASMVGGLDLAETEFGAATAGRLGKLKGALIPASEEGIFKSTRKGFVSRLSKALGEVGFLTDADIERAVGLIPDLTDTPASAQEKITRLKSMLSSTRELYQQTVSPMSGYGY